MLLIMASLLLPMQTIQAATVDVTVLNNRFSPNNMTIQVGDTVRWTNMSSTHDVTADDGRGDFGSVTSNNFVYMHTFTSVEEFLYYCSVHSFPGQNISSNMNGRINILAGNATTDVSVESVDVIGGAHEAGEDFRTKVTLKNNGDSDSGMFNISFYVSTDNNVTSGDTLLETMMVSNISAGGSRNLDESINLPGGLEVGDYFIGVIIDLADTNLGNNTGVDDTAIFVFIEFLMNAGLNDAWFDPETDGQGFFVTVFPGLGVVTIAWFTYDIVDPPNGVVANLGYAGHRWLNGLGDLSGDSSVLNITIASGGIFDTPTEITREPDGTITLKFNNCSEGTATYNIPSINQQGVVPIRRVAGDNEPLCVKLLRDATLEAQ